MRAHVPHQDGITIGIGAHRAGRACRSTCTGNVLNHNLLAERAGHVLADDAGGNVGSPAGSKRNYHCNRPRRIGLRPHDLRQRGQRDSAHGQMQKLPSVAKFHGIPSPKMPATRRFIPP
jgi:hypothetical protein